MQNKVKNGVRKPTLCEKCRRSAGLCPWSHHFEPVDGWTAEAIVMYGQDGNGNKRPINTYRVIACPGFDEFKPR